METINETTREGKTDYTKFKTYISIRDYIETEHEIVASWFAMGMENEEEFAKEYIEQEASERRTIMKQNPNFKPFEVKEQLVIACKAWVDLRFNQA